MPSLVTPSMFSRGNALDVPGFPDLLAEYAPPHGLSILGFCLMSNHFHLVAVPEREDSLARTIGGWKPTMRAMSMFAAGRQGISGKRGSSLFRWSRGTARSPWRTWNATPFGREW